MSHTGYTKLNLGQVQYFDEYSQEPIDIDGFREELIRSGLNYDEKKNIFTYYNRKLDEILITYITRIRIFQSFTLPTSA